MHVPALSSVCDIMAASRVLVYGGKGALGTSVVNYFKSKNWVCLNGVCVLNHSLPLLHWLSCVSTVGTVSGHLPE